MRVLEADDWSLLLPDEWLAEREADAIIIGDRDGVGCLEISELRQAHEDAAEGAAKSLDLSQFREPDLPWDATRCGNFSGFASFLVEDGMAIREWYLQAADLLLFATYSCDLENRGLDDAAVDEILSTLRYVSAHAAERPSRHNS